MGKKLKFKEKVHDLEKKGKIPLFLAAGLIRFYDSYTAAVLENPTFFETDSILLNYLDLILKQVQHPFLFEPYHSKMNEYYKLGNDFVRPILDIKNSQIYNIEIVDRIAEQISKKENAVLLANHQSELDPQILSLLLENNHPELAENMIFVAGHRVITDPLAVPFSKGRNLLCIHSKKYIDHPPEQKRGKISHNQRTMKRMLELLSEGGKCIYVAPSGGRDRKDLRGDITPSPFDAQSIEMFSFIASHAKQPTHFYPLALCTYDLFPPPEKVSLELGEERRARFSPVYISFGSEIDMEHLPGSNVHDKEARRKLRAESIWESVCTLYKNLTT